jgi:phosphoketolase
VGQIYLKENPMLREPLKAEHIKPRSATTTPGNDATMTNQIQVTIFCRPSDPFSRSAV